MVSASQPKITQVKPLPHSGQSALLGLMNDSMTSITAIHAQATHDKLYDPSSRESEPKPTTIKQGFATQDMSKGLMVASILFIVYGIIAK